MLARSHARPYRTNLGRIREIDSILCQPASLRPFSGNPGQHALCLREDFASPLKILDEDRKVKRGSALDQACLSSFVAFGAVRAWGILHKWEPRRYYSTCHSRGMSASVNLLGRLGGYPLEFARPAAVFEFCTMQEFGPE